MTDEVPGVEYEYETVHQDDPVRRWLMYGVIFVILAILLLVVFALLSGLFAQQAPRTSTEARLVSLKNAAEGAPGSGAAQRDYIEALVLSGQYDAAQKQADLMKEQLSGFEKTYVYVGELAIPFAQEDYEATVTLAQEAYEYEIGAQEAWVQEQEAAGLQVTKALLEQQNVIGILVYQARATGAAGDDEGAIEYLSLALDLDPTAADLLVVRGQAYLIIGDKEAARADFEQALVYIPDFQSALDGLNELDSE